MENPVVHMGERGLIPTSLNGLRELADLLLTAGLFPTNIKNRKTEPQRQAEICVMIAAGYEVGLTPIQSLDCICIINGRPCFYGDALPGLVHASGMMLDHEEWVTGEGMEMVGHCRVKRCGVDTEYVRTFSAKDANQANLWNRSGPWKQYPKRMLVMRARGFCFRDAFADVLKGIKTVEEVRDYPQNQGVEGIQEVKTELLPPPKKKKVVKVSKGGPKGPHWMKTPEGEKEYNRLVAAFVVSKMSKKEANEYLRHHSNKSVDDVGDLKGAELVAALTIDDIKVIADRLETENEAKEAF